MFASPAYAATSGAGAGGTASFMMQIFPLVLIFIIFYFLLIRPQQRRVKQHQSMVEAVQFGWAGVLRYAASTRSAATLDVRGTAGARVLSRHGAETKCRIEGALHPSLGKGASP